MENKTRKRALVLSGGGSRGAYEAGVWQALAELGMEIDIVTGTSVGALNGAMVVQGDLELTIKLWKEIETHMIFDVAEGTQPIEYVKEIIDNNGAGTTGLKKLIEKYVNENVIRNSQMEYGVVACELPSMKPHYMFKENMKPGQIVDYIMASTAIFPAIHSYEIEGTEYIDGGYADVLPVEMAMEKGATEIIAVYLEAVGVLRHDKVKEAKEKVDSYVQISPSWDLGSVLVFDTNNARRIMRLGYLDTMKTYGVFDGKYYTFVKSTFDKTTTKMADAAAKVFELDPCLIYTHDCLIETIRKQIVGAGEDFLATVEKYRASTRTLDWDLKHLKELKNIANKRIFAIIVAEDILENGADSPFIKRTAIKLFPEIILAGRFLAKFELA